MWKIFNVFVVIFFVLHIASVNAQILDDEDVNDIEDALSALSSDKSFDETDADEAYFNEIFSDYSETDRDITKIKTFDDAMDKTADLVKILEEVNKHPQKDEELPPLDGDLLIGISRGSFNIYKNSIGKPECSFRVTLKSNLNRNIKTLGVNLRYSFQSFAFIFRNISAYGSQEQTMRTVGFACYQMSDTPDLDVNFCKIRTASGRECIQRLKWVKNIDSPIDQ